VETIVLPLDINISDAIMNFQGSGFQVTQKVFDACGTPKFLTSSSKRRRRDANAVADRSGSGRAISLEGGGADRQAIPEGVKKEAVSSATEQSTRQPDHQQNNKGKSEFQKMMEELRRTVSEMIFLNLSCLDSILSDA
jgi:hypothetical protein